MISDCVIITGGARRIGGGADRTLSEAVAQVMSDAEVLDREVQLTIAQSNYSNRAGSLDRCRTVLFPTLENILGRAE